jgi:pyruvate/2-oxoglutarate dehydrogenase complex dihydrolipoamide acyltransferase (E2) component
LNRTKDERGQVLSSLVAVLAVVAIVGGLLVLFGTRGDDSVADAKPADQTSSPTPKPSTTPTSAPTTAPSSAPTSAPVETPSVKPSTPPVETPVVPPSKPVTIPPSERPAVEVYNNTPRKGLAEDVAIRARQTGWVVAGRDNWHGKIATSTVYYPPGMQAEAGQLARDIGISSTKEALPNMKKDRLSVILTTDYTG